MSKLLRPRIVLTVTGTIVVFILFSLAQEMNRRWQVEREVSRLEQEAQELQKNVIELENLNQYFKTPDFQERLAREKLNYRAPGEEVVLIPEQEQPKEVETVKSQLIKPTISSSVPLRWWNAFFSAEPPALNRS